MSNTKFPSTPKYWDKQFAQFTNSEFTKKHEKDLDSFTLSYGEHNNNGVIEYRKEEELEKKLSKREAKPYQNARRILCEVLNQEVQYTPIIDEIFKEYKDILDYKNNSTPLRLRDVVNIKNSVESKRIKRYIESLKLSFDLIALPFPEITQKAIDTFKKDIAFFNQHRSIPDESFLSFPHTTTFPYRYAFNQFFGRILKDGFEEFASNVFSYKEASDEKKKELAEAIKNANPYFRAVFMTSCEISSIVHKLQLKAFTELDILDFAKLFVSVPPKDKLDFFNEDGCYASNILRELHLLKLFLIELSTEQDLQKNNEKEFSPSPLDQILNRVVQRGLTLYLADRAWKPTDDGDGHLRCNHYWAPTSEWNFKKYENPYLKKIFLAINDNVKENKEAIPGLINQVFDEYNQSENKPKEHLIEKAFIDCIKKYILSFEETKEDKCLVTVVKAITEYNIEINNVLPQPIRKIIKQYELNLKEDPNNPYKHIAKLLFTFATDKECRSCQLGEDPSFFVLLNLACHISNNLPVPSFISQKDIMACKSSNGAERFLRNPKTWAQNYFKPLKYPKGITTTPITKEMQNLLGDKFVLNDPQNDNADYPVWNSLFSRIFSTLMPTIQGLEDKKLPHLSFVKLFILSQFSKAIGVNRAFDFKSFLNKLLSVKLDSSVKLDELLESSSVANDEDFLKEVESNQIIVDKKMLEEAEQTKSLFIPLLLKQIESDDYVVLADPVSFKLSVKHKNDKDISPESIQKALDLLFIALKDSADETEFYRITNSIFPREKLTLKVFSRIVKEASTPTKINDIYKFYQGVLNNKDLSLGFYPDDFRLTNNAIKATKDYKKEIEQLGLNIGQSSLTFALGDKLMEFVKWLQGDKNILEPEYVTKQQKIVLDALTALIEFNNSFKKTHGVNASVPYVLPYLLSYVPNPFSLELFGGRFLFSQLRMLEDSLSKTFSSFKEYVKENTLLLSLGHNPIIAGVGENATKVLYNERTPWIKSTQILLPDDDAEKQDKFLSNFNNRYKTEFSRENLAHPKGTLFQITLTENFLQKEKLILSHIAAIFDKGLKECKSDDQKHLLIVETLRDILVWNVFPGLGEVLIPPMQAFLCQHAKIPHFVINAECYLDTDAENILKEIESDGEKNLKIIDKKMTDLFDLNNENLLKNWQIWQKHLDNPPPERQKLVFKIPPITGKRDIKKALGDFKKNFNKNIELLEDEKRKELPEDTRSLKDLLKQFEDEKPKVKKKNKKVEIKEITNEIEIPEIKIEEIEEVEEKKRPNEDPKEDVVQDTNFLSEFIEGEFTEVKKKTYTKPLRKPKQVKNVLKNQPVKAENKIQNLEIKKEVPKEIFIKTENLNTGNKTWAEIVSKGINDESSEIIPVTYKTEEDFWNTNNVPLDLESEFGFFNSDHEVNSSYNPSENEETSIENDMESFTSEEPPVFSEEEEEFSDNEERINNPWQHLETNPVLYQPNITSNTETIEIIEEPEVVQKVEKKVEDNYGLKGKPWFQIMEDDEKIEKLESELKITKENNLKLIQMIMPLMNQLKSEDQESLLKIILMNQSDNSKN